MKSIQNWRFFVKAVLFAGGCGCLLLSTGNDNKPTGEWLLVHGGLSVLGIGMLYALLWLSQHWDSKYPEINQQNCLSDAINAEDECQ